MFALVGLLTLTGPTLWAADPADFENPPPPPNRPDPAALRERGAPRWLYRFFWPMTNPLLLAVFTAVEAEFEGLIDDV